MGDRADDPSPPDRAPQGGGACASRSAKPARPLSRKRCTHLRPVWRLIPVGVQTRHVVEAPDRQSSMRFLRSSIGPVSIQGILEVSTTSSDHTPVARLPASVPF